MSNKPYLLALNQISGIGPRTILKLQTLWPSLKDCFALSIEQLKQAGLPLALAQAIHQIDWKSIEPTLQFEKQANQHIITWDDPIYPSLLKEIYDAPPVLYAIGNLSCLHQPLLAMVGSRHPSPSGRETAFKWAKELSQSPLTIVSGLALGIDAAVHQGCLSAGGKTIAVLGTGVDIIYPPQHRSWAGQITNQGLILSEFPLKTAVKAGHFPRRNRIISGLSLATLVMEATLKSGSLITARFALEHNRDVLTLPGSIHLPQAQGCHHLLKQGATLVTCYQDVLAEIGLATEKEKNRPAKKNDVSSQSGLRQNIHPAEKSVLDCIGFEPTHIDIIIRRSGLQANQVISHLSALEIEGMISQVTGGYIQT